MTMTTTLPLITRCHAEWLGMSRSVAGGYVLVAGPARDALRHLAGSLLVADPDYDAVEVVRRIPADAAIAALEHEADRLRRVGAGPLHDPEYFVPEIEDCRYAAELIRGSISAEGYDDEG